VAIRAGAPLADALAQARQSVTSAGFDLDYLEARDAETLASVASPGEAPLRLLVAARIGTTRLIDNIAV
jgi:pantoate--beta-alanine ligase